MKSRFILLISSLSLCFAAIIPLSLSSGEVHLSPRGESSPNPITAQYPTRITGTLNSTLAVIPISYKVARSIIPARYGILKEAYLSLLPGFPRDKYPLVVRASFDHGVGISAYNFSLDDFQAIHIWYPFIDVLNDGYTSIVYNNHLLLTSTNTLAIEGTGADGTIPVPASFKPELEAYGYVAGKGEGKGKKEREIYLNAYTSVNAGCAAVETRFKVVDEVGPWGIEFYKNITNQPITSAGVICDNQINLWNTTLSSPHPSSNPLISPLLTGIKGTIKIADPYFPGGGHFQHIHGIKVDVAFVEYPGGTCVGLKGYHGTGSGD